MKRIFILVAFGLLMASVVWGATYLGNTIVDLNVGTPDGSVEPVSILDDAQREAKRAMVQTYYSWASLTNKTGGGLVIGDVVCLDSTNDNAVALCDTASSLQKYVVAVQSIANNANGLFARNGRVLVNVTGAITRGHYVVKSVTTKVVVDSAVANSATTVPPSAAIGIALTADSASQATIDLFDSTTPIGPAVTLGSGVTTLSSGDITTVSNAMVNATGVAVTITKAVTASVVMVGFTGMAQNSTAGQVCEFDILADTTSLFSDGNNTVGIGMTGTGEQVVTLTTTVSGLAIGSHTFQVKWRAGANTCTLFADATRKSVIWAKELL